MSDKSKIENAETVDHGVKSAELIKDAEIIHEKNPLNDEEVDEKNPLNDKEVDEKNPLNDEEVDEKNPLNDEEVDEKNPLNGEEVDEKNPLNDEEVDEKNPLNEEEVDEKNPLNDEEVDEKNPLNDEEVDEKNPLNDEEVDEKNPLNDEEVDEKNPLNDEEVDEKNPLNDEEVDEKNPLNDEEVENKIGSSTFAASQTNDNYSESEAFLASPKPNLDDLNTEKIIPIEKNDQDDRRQIKSAEKLVIIPTAQSPVGDEIAAVEKANKQTNDVVVTLQEVDKNAAEIDSDSNNLLKTSQTNIKADDERVDSESSPFAIVNFLLESTSANISIKVSVDEPISSYLKELSEKFQQDASSLILNYQDAVLDPSQNFHQVGIKAGSTKTILVQSKDQKTSLSSKQESASAIKVRVLKDNNFQEVIVKIEKCSRKKPFLGGFIHKLTRIEYHNASAQTKPKPLRHPKNKLFHRDTQTYKQVQRPTQTANISSTQTEVPGLYISKLQDKYICPKPYVTADEYLAKRLRAIIIIQRYLRKWLAIRRCEKLRKLRNERLEWEAAEEIRKRKVKEDRIRKEFERRMNLRTKEDFDLAYAALEKWRLEEISNINAEMMDEPTRKAALCALLDQQTQYITSIERHKIEANKNNRIEKTHKLLEKAAAPKRWKAFDGRYTLMDTQFTIRAKEMSDIYNSITMKYLTQDERLDVLLTLKHTVKQHNCKLTRDIIELIDREADLIMRSVSDCNLEGLRQRIATLFLEYCKTPMFNPEIAKHLKVPQDSTKLKENVYFCDSVNQYLSSSEFQIQTNARSHGKSKKAIETDNIARSRQDLSPYRYLLQKLRESEAEYGSSDNKSAFIIQERDLQYLVDKIWMSQSVLSSWDDLYDLVFVRWDKKEDWSPWNCVLLTIDEAKAHLKLEKLTESYGEIFINKIRHKHTHARIYFNKLHKMNAKLVKKRSSSLTGLQELPG